MKKNNTSETAFKNLLVSHIDLENEKVEVEKKLGKTEDMYKKLLLNNTSLTKRHNVLVNEHEVLNKSNTDLKGKYSKLQEKTKELVTLIF